MLVNNVSLFRFIASDFELPEVEYNNFELLTYEAAKEKNLISQDYIASKDKPILYCKDNHLEEFVIKKYNYSYSEYTQKKFIYELILNSDRDKEVLYLFAYINENVVNREIDLYTIWLDDYGYKKIKYDTVLIKDLNFIKLKDLLNKSSEFVGSNYSEYAQHIYCICIKG